MIALVPVKRLGEGKSRLLGALAPRDPARDLAARDALTLAMLGDVLEALRGVAALARIAVVTPDAKVARAARAADAEPLLLHAPGLNPALDAAREKLCAPEDALLVLLGDVAGARSDDIAALIGALDELGERGVVLAPARDGGSAALLRAPARVIPNCFGARSAAAHEAAARAAGVPFRAHALPSLRVDLDRRADLEALLASDAPAPRTRALLAQLGIGAARAEVRA